MCLLRMRETFKYLRQMLLQELVDILEPKDFLKKNVMSVTYSRYIL